MARIPGLTVITPYYWQTYTNFRDTTTKDLNTSRMGTWRNYQVTTISDSLITTRVTNTKEFAQVLCNYLNAYLDETIREKQILHINSVPYFTNKGGAGVDATNLTALALGDLAANLNIDATQPARHRSPEVDNIPVFDTDNKIACEIVMLLAMLKLKVYFIDEFNKTDKKLFDKILANIINTLQTNDQDLNNKYLDANNTQDELSQTIKNKESYNKKFAIIVDILQNQIDLSDPDSDAMQFFNLINNIPILKELTLDTLIKTIQRLATEDKNIDNNYKNNYNKVISLINNIPIDNWLAKDPSISLQILAKQSLEFIMFSTLTQQQSPNDSYIKSDELYLYILLHAASKKINYHIEDFTDFIKNNSIDDILEKPAKLIKILENTIHEIKNEIQVNILDIKPPQINKTEDIVNNIVNNNVVRVTEIAVKLNPVILTIPDHPIILREIAKNKRISKRGYGENRCPCGSGKKLRDCCGKKREPEE